MISANVEMSLNSEKQFRSKSLNTLCRAWHADPGTGAGDPWKFVYKFQAGFKEPCRTNLEVASLRVGTNSLPRRCGQYW